MRVLLTTTGDAGHVLPLLPFARAFLRAGHEVCVTAPRSRGHVVERTGLPWRPVDDPPEDEVGPVWATAFDASAETANEIVIGQIFGRLKMRAALPGVLEVVERWRPDVIVRESYEFASTIAAERYGIPQLRVATGLASTEEWLLAIAETATDGLPVEQIRAAPYFTLNPPAFEDPRAPGPIRTHRFREEPKAPQPLPDWWPGSDDPLVYLSFGSVAGAMPFLYPHLYRAAIDALANLPARILVTIGNAGDPAELGPLTANVHVERWVAQAAVAPHAAAMVVHGGYGSTLGALLHGVPLVIAPLFADQARNARRVAEIGAGLALPEAGSLTQAAQDGPRAIAAIGDAVRHVLAEPNYRRAARGVAAGAAGLPPVDAAADALSAFAAHDLAA